MAKFIITCDVIRAAGWQQWSVEASDEAEAIEKFDNGDGDFVAEDVEVTDVGTPSVELDDSK